MDKHSLSSPFKMTLAIENTACYERFEKGKRTLYISGRASGTQIDHDAERVAKTALLAIQKAIEDGLLQEDGTVVPVPLQSEHERRWDDTLGHLTKAWIDEHWDLWVEAELDEDNPRSHYLYNKLTKSGQGQKHYGLSIGGYVLEAGSEWSDELQKNIRVFYDVGLTEVSVTSRPAYPTAYLNALNKSVAWDGVKHERQMVVTEELMKSIKKSIKDTLVEEAAAQAAANAEAEAVDAGAEVAEKSETAEIETEQVEKTEGEAPIEDAEAEVTKSETPIIMGETAPENIELPVNAEVVKTEDAVAQIAESVAKADTSVRVNIESSAYGWDGSPDTLADVIGSLINEIEGMKGVLKSITDAPSEAAVEKSEGESEQAEGAVEKTADPAPVAAETVEKSGTEAADEAIEKALNDALGAMLDEKLAPMIEAIGGLNKRVEEVESQEVDGSIAVSKAIGNTPDQDDDPEAQLEKHLEGLTGAARISKLMRLQREGQ